MKFNYCPNCGKKGSVVHENPSKYVCNSCGWEFWNNPNATSSAIFIKDGKTLFAKRGIEPNKGKYDFPGGFVDYGEDIYDACVREVMEETGVKIDKADLYLLTGYTFEYKPGVSNADLLFVIEKWQGDFKATDDVDVLEWKPFDFIDSGKLAPSYPGLANKLKKQFG